MPQENKEMEKEGIGKRVLIWGHKCYRCSHAWRPYNLDEAPRVCPKCKSPYWDRPKKNKQNKEAKK